MNETQTKENGMTRNEINKVLSAVLTTAIETEPAAFPESYIYLAVGSDIEKAGLIRSVLEKGALATFTGNSLQLTETGRKIAAQIQSFNK